AGEIGHSHQWYTPRSLDSCRIDSSEEIRRMTYCPPPQTSAAAQFREGRLQRVAHLNALLADGTHLPLALADLRDGFRLEWHVDSPHQNVVSTKGERATVIYLGDDATPKRAEEVRSRAAEYLRLHAAEDEQ